jgi:hypothetical protein
MRCERCNAEILESDSRCPVCYRKAPTPDLKTDPLRTTGKWADHTGIRVRAKHGDTEGFGSVDIAELDAKSLLTWLRSRGGKNVWAENIVGTLLGHPESIAEDE